MGLVGYSDSEESGAENGSSTQEVTSNNGLKPAKPKFQKLIDRSDPHKIQVSLADSTGNGQTNQDEDGSERPGKRPRTDAGGFSGFNAMLPAPKKSAPLSSRTAHNSAKKAIGSGISLKTGPAPSFTRELLREAEPNADNAIENGGLDAIEKQPQQIHTDAEAAPSETSSTAVTQPDIRKKGNAMMFKPLSVARKPQKKKAVPQTKPNVASADIQAADTTSTAAKASRASIFSMDDSENDRSILAGHTAKLEYQPYYSDATERLEDVEPSETQQRTDPAQTAPQAQLAQAESLESLASSLNLTPAQRRQLFGRNATDKRVTVTTFNADAEYTANEEQRRAAEADGAQQQQPHNPVRAIAPGKHSLKQLVNAVAGQRDALEESFATGKRNRQEAGSKYGW